MKQTMALVDFMAATETSMIEAIGIIDQLHELEKSGRNLEQMNENVLSAYLREPIKRVKKSDLIKNYFQFKTRENSELKSEYNKNYFKKKKVLTERERSAPSSPFLPPTPPNIPPISPEERESENTPLHLRCRPPEGAHTPSKRFCAPTEEEVQAYADEKGYKGFEAQRFVDFYASKGWLVGKSPMKDWKAAVRGWATRDKHESRTQLDRNPRANPALNYDQREYSNDEFDESFFVDLSKYD